MEADRGHLHHRLLDMGFSQKQTVSILYLISTVLGLSAVVLIGVGAIRALVLLAAVIVAIVVAFIVIRKDEENKEIDDERIIRFNDNSESGETNEEN
jgi:UDP-GlcNAc:undecaprenyl-phosphate GlcNAc-1-phosphate transferase